MSSLFGLTRTFGLIKSLLPNKTISYSRSIHNMAYSKPTRSFMRSLGPSRPLHTTVPTNIARSIHTKTVFFRPTKTTMSHAFTRPSLGLGTSNLLCRNMERRLYNAGSHRSSYADQSTLNLRILYGLIGLNVGIWLYFLYTKSLAIQGHMQRLEQFIQHMTMNVHEVLGRKMYWQTLTSCFTHFDVMHIVFNMVAAYTIGSMIAVTPGVSPVKFLTLIIGSGFMGSLGSIVQRVYYLEKGKVDITRSLGFSGCVSGMMVAVACMHPRSQVLLMAVIPIPLWALGIGYIVYDGYYVNDPRSSTGHAGHLGGALFGAVFWALKLRGLGRGFYG